MRTDDISNISGVMSSVGTSNLGNALDGLMRSAAPFDMSSIFAFKAGAPPKVLHDGYSARVSANALTSYLKGGYLLDPFYAACLQGTPEGLWRMRQLAPDEYFSSDIGSLGSVHQCISEEAGSLVEEIGFVCTMQDDWSSTYSLMRNRTSVEFSSRDFEALSSLSPLVCATLRRHWSLTASDDVGHVGGEVGSVLRRAFFTRLTPAQYRVVELTLRGHSTISVARELHIAEGTAKLHKHNAYQRLGISSQTELFRLFLDSLEAV